MSMVSSGPLAPYAFTAGGATVADDEDTGRSALAGAGEVLGALGVIEGILGAGPDAAGSPAGAAATGGWAPVVGASLGGRRLVTGAAGGACEGASIQGGRAASADVAPVTGAAQGSVGGGPFGDWAGP